MKRLGLEWLLRGTTSGGKSQRPNFWSPRAGGDTDPPLHQGIVKTFANRDQVEN